IRFGRPDIVKRFQRSGRTGFYFAVIREGEVGAGDPIELVEAAGDRIPVADAFRAATDRAADRDLLRRLSELPALAEGWREEFRARLSG
ncbi:MAG: 3-alpha domain-containing protein, partial [Myxococcota bacterium]